MFVSMEEVLRLLSGSPGGATICGEGCEGVCVVGYSGGLGATVGRGVWSCGGVGCGGVRGYCVWKGAACQVL